MHQRCVQIVRNLLGLLFGVSCSALARASLARYSSRKRSYVLLLAHFILQPDADERGFFVEERPNALAQPLELLFDGRSVALRDVRLVDFPDLRHEFGRHVDAAQQSGIWRSTTAHGRRCFLPPGVARVT
jgi:hypothetical protein